VLSEETATTIASWAPRRHSEAVCRFARSVVTASCPTRPARARALLFAAGTLAEFACSVGVELEAKLVLHPSVIERFCASSRAGSAPTRRTLRSNLRHLANRAVADVPPGATPMPRERAKPPYSARELASYLALADAQPTALRRERANALVCLGAGAGLIGTELRGVRGADVVSRSGGVLVGVTGRRPRAVPVLSDYHDRLLLAASFFGDRYLVAGRNPDSHNVTNPLIRSLSGGLDLPRLEPARLRSSYLVAMAEAIGLRAFMDAAGITCSQRLGDLVGHLEATPEERAVVLLGASASCGAGAPR
jgi:integrase